MSSMKTLFHYLFFILIEMIYLFFKKKTMFHILIKGFYLKIPKGLFNIIKKISIIFILK